MDGFQGGPFWITQVLKEVPCRHQAPEISARITAILAPASSIAIGAWVATCSWIAMGLK